MQQGDVKLYQTNDDGEIHVLGGIMKMTGGLETAVYLSLFGGNEDDDGREGNAENWWGNLDETDPAMQYRSETQNLLQSLPPTSGNLIRVEDAVSRDIQWLVDKKIASSISTSASIPELNQIKISISTRVDGLDSSFEFIEQWRATQ